MRVQPQPMVDVLTVDVAQKIFIGGDAERGRTAVPFDLKSAIGLNFGKIADRTCVSDNVTVAHNTAPTAAGSQKNQPGQESDRNLIHNSTLADETRRPAVLDSRICIFVIPSGVEESLTVSALGNIKRCLDFARHDNVYFETLNFTVSAG